MNRVRALLVVASVAVAIGIWVAMTAPADALQGVYSRFLPLHVPSLWLAFLAFGVTAFGSVMWLWRKQDRWDDVAAASAEIGVLFTGIGLFTGMVWGQAVWGIPWDWQDPRLMTTAVMFFVYLGYLALRSAVDDPTTRARRSAILGAIAVVQVPLVYFSVNLWRTLHQTASVRPGGSTMPDELLIALLINVATFTLLYIALMAVRIDLARAEAGHDPSQLATPDPVLPPRLSEVDDV